jgi:hypothetical protein
VVGLLLREFAEQQVEAAVDDAHALDVVKRRLSRFEKNLKSKIHLYTVKPVYNGHPWDLKNVAVMQRVI